MRLEIDHGYDTATEAFVNGNHVAALHYDNLTGKLCGYAGMAGNDSTSTDFALAYDTGAQDAVEALDDLVDAFANVGRLTDTSITNHRHANRNSVLGSATVYDGTAPLPTHGYLDVPPVSIPTSLGSDLSSFPDELNWILDQVEGFVWPNADTSRLREAGLAWQTAADDLDRLTGYCTRPSPCSTPNAPPKSPSPSTPPTTSKRWSTTSAPTSAPSAKPATSTPTTSRSNATTSST